MIRTYGPHGKSSVVVKLWAMSIGAARRGWWLPARILKFTNYIVFRAILPPEANIKPDLRLGHSALGTVIHPNTDIGHRVRIWHHVTIASSADVGSDDRVVIEDDVEIGAGAVLLNRRGRTLRVGRGASIGANTTVTHDVPAGATVVSAAPRVLRKGLDSRPADAP